MLIALCVMTFVAGFFFGALSLTLIGIHMENRAKNKSAKVSRPAQTKTTLSY